MTQVLDRMRRTIAQYALLPERTRVVVGVSGGPDSLCLLHGLCRLRAEYGITLHVAHLHHGLRGPEADGDAEFVQTLAADWRLPCTLEYADVPALASSLGLATEEAARRARYAFLSQVARETASETIAVGHNADDQAETVLMHWLRGSGLAGLRGMLPLTALADYRLLDPPGALSPAANLRLIRPLLEVTRADIEEYCTFFGLEPRFDRSNLDTTYFRNWLRHRVIPLLEEHNPKVRRVIRRSAQVIADDYALLRSVLEEAWSRVVLEERPQISEPPGEKIELMPSIAFDQAAWRALPTSLQRSTLREAIHRLRSSLRNINFVHVENALLVARDGKTGDQATLPGGLVLTVGYTRLVVAGTDAAEPMPNWPLLAPSDEPLLVNLPGDTPLPDSDWVLRAELVSIDDLTADWQGNRNPWFAFLDAEAAGQTLELRNRRPGDRFCPLGLGGHSVKLADFLTNQKVPRVFRDRIPLLEGESGLLWMCGQRPDHKVRIRHDTQQVLVLRFLRIEH